MSRQLSALARLGALGHLDLDVVSVDQVLVGHPETPRRHLLDGGALRVSGTVRQRFKSFGLLASLTGIRLAAQPVHRHRQGGVGLIGDAAEGHGAGGKSLHDLLGRLHLVQRDLLFRPVEVEQAAQGEQPLLLLVHRAGKYLIAGPIVGTAGMLQSGDGLRRPGMILATQPVSIIPTRIQALEVDRVVAVGIAVPSHRVLGNLLDAGTLHRGSGTGKILLDEGAGQAHRIEYLGAAIGLVGGYPHLGHHLLQTLAQRLDVTLLGLVKTQPFRQLRQHRLHGVKRHVGIDRLGTIACQGGKMMDLQGRPGLHHQARLGAQALADQMVVHGGGCQQRRDSDIVGIHVAVRQDQDVETFTYRHLGARAQCIQGRLHAGHILLGRVAYIQGAGAEGTPRVVLDIPDPLQVGIGQHRLADTQPHVAPADRHPASYCCRRGTDSADWAGVRSGRPGTSRSLRESGRSADWSPGQSSA